MKNNDKIEVMYEKEGKMCKKCTKIIDWDISRGWKTVWSGKTESFFLCPDCISMLKIQSNTRINLC